MKNSVVDTIIGAVVIVIAAAFFFYAYTVADANTGRGGYLLTAEFDSVDGINTGSDVRLAGIKVGTVVEQKLNPQTFQALVTLSLDDDVKLPDDTTAKITSEGLLGSKFIALDPGGSETILQAGDTLTYTQGAIDLWGMINQFMFNSGSGAGQ